MKIVLLINQNKTPHYRIGVYNYLSSYLHKLGYHLTVLSEGTQEGSGQAIEYDHNDINLTFFNIRKTINNINPDVTIFWINLKHLYLLPLLLYLKFTKRKMIYWGHGVDLLDKQMTWLKKKAYHFEHWISDAIILYGDHLKTNVNKRFHNKTFIANNTLYFNDYPLQHLDKQKILANYSITTQKNIICIGRMQRRKRIDHLYKAFLSLDRTDLGLIFVGPDDEGILNDIKADKVFKIPPIYGFNRLDLLYAADVFCLPGAIGLSIVDAFYCGLPIVTENGDMSPEIMYLKNGVNGFVVPQGDIDQLAEKLILLLDNTRLREEFGRAAKEEISNNGSMAVMCKGFRESLQFVANK